MTSYENLAVGTFNFLVHFVKFNFRNPHILQGFRGYGVFSANSLKEMILKIFIEPGQLKPKVNINRKFLFVNIYDIYDCEREIKLKFVFQSIFKVDWRETFLVLSSEHNQAAVLLVRPVLAVLEVVADQRGVDAGSKVAAEVPGLREVSVEV